MNTFEEKRQARIDRLHARADNARAASSAAFAEATRLGDMIPMGQPILVGHHSEKGHRRHLQRIDNAMRRSCEEAHNAKDLADRAEAAEKNRAVFTEDPEAEQKLTKKLAHLEAERDRGKIINATIRKHAKAGTEAQVAALVAQELCSESVARGLLTPDFCGRIGLPDYFFQNTGAEIRRIKQRLEELKARASEETTERTVGEVTVTENVEENRLQLFFPDKPDEATRANLKRWGFRWAPSVGAWQRHLNNTARYAAEQVLKDGAAS